MAKNWIKSAIRPGSKGKFAAKAAAAGESTAQYATENADAPGTLGKEARLARTLMHLGHKPEMSKSSHYVGKKSNG